MPKRLPDACVPHIECSYGNFTADTAACRLTGTNQRQSQPVREEILSPFPPFIPPSLHLPPSPRSSSSLSSLSLSPPPSVPPPTPLHLPTSKLTRPLPPTTARFSTSPCRHGTRVSTGGKPGKPGGLVSSPPGKSPQRSAKMSWPHGRARASPGHVRQHLLRGRGEQGLVGGTGAGGEARVEDAEGGGGVGTVR